MRRKCGRLLVVMVLLLTAAPSSEQAYSRQKGAGVAGGGRISRGKNDSFGAAAGRRAPAVSNDEGAARPRASLSASRDIESLEQQCLDEVNDIRRVRHLPPLSFLEDLLPVAREYSRRMAEERFFSHTDPEGRSVRERVEEAEIKWLMVGENLAYTNGYINPVAASLRGWMESPGHRRNILDRDFSRTAIGVWVSSDGTVYFTEIFLKQ
jgi:uncharacterized protein YkwD